MPTTAIEEVAVAKAIVEALSDDPDLQELIGDQTKESVRINEGKGKAGWSYPFVIYQLITGLPDTLRVGVGGRALARPLFQVKAVDYGTDRTIVSAIAFHVDRIFETLNVVTDGFEVSGVRRQEAIFDSDTDSSSEDNSFFNVGGTYVFHVRKV